jgi:hypothetical protein
VGYTSVDTNRVSFAGNGNTEVSLVLIPFSVSIALRRVLAGSYTGGDSFLPDHTLAVTSYTGGDSFLPDHTLAVTSHTGGDFAAFLPDHPLAVTLPDHTLAVTLHAASSEKFWIAF